nr:hypothetical protein [Tanacetum cinerariifolium]
SGSKSLAKPKVTATGMVSDTTKITSSKVLPVEHSSSVSTSMDVVVSSRFTEMPVTSYKRKARKAPDMSVSTAN